MNKDSFFKLLNDNLKDIESQDKKELMADFNEHFEMGIADGKSEEELCSSLGDPVQIAKQFKVECTLTKAQKNVTSSNLFQAILATLGLGVFNCTFVLLPFFLVLLMLFSFYLIIGSLLITSIVTIFTTMFCILKYHILGILAVILFAISGTALNLFLILQLNKLSIWIFKIALKYMQLNLKIITGREK